MNNQLDFRHDYILENDIVLLRPLSVADYQHLVHFSIEEPFLWDFSVSTGAGEKNFQNYLAAALNGRNQQHQYPFVVFDKRTKAYAGSTRFYDFQVLHRTTQLGYTWYGTPFQGTGLNKHCKFLLLEFAFDYLGLQRVELRADNNNARSIAAMKSIGCQVEGILREHCAKPDGGRRDSIILSILKSEWESGGKDMLRNKLKF